MKRDKTERLLDHGLMTGNLMLFRRGSGPLRGGSGSLRIQGVPQILPGHSVTARLHALPALDWSQVT